MASQPIAKAQRVSRPRLLFVSPRFLLPLDEGGKIRTVGTLRAMKDGAFDITLVSPAPADLTPFQADIASVCDHFRSWPQPPVNLFTRLAGLLGSTPVSAATDRSPAALRVVAKELAGKPDLALFDFAHAGVLMPAAIDLPTIMFTHNIEAEILERHARVAKGPMRFVWQREAAKMRAFEGKALSRFDTVIAVSARDAAGFEKQFGLESVRIIDTGVDLDYYGYHAPSEQTETVIFSGAMDSRSNIDGIEFLMNEVWPIVAARRPQARMIVAGRNPPQHLVDRANERGLPWRFTGFVDDIRPSVLSGSVSVIPLRVGSGTRLKVFESMALGRPIISTALGVEGLPVEPGRHYVGAETAEDFARAIDTMLEDAALRVQIAEGARRLLEGRYSWEQIGRAFERICLDTLGYSPSEAKSELARSA